MKSRAIFPACLLVAVFALFASATAHAQQQQCLGVNGGQVTADPFPPGVDQPTSCELWSNGVRLDYRVVVDSTKIRVDNSTVCSPPDAPYNPGPPGSKSCLVHTGPLALGPASFTIRTVNAKGRAPDSPPLNVIIVDVLPGASQISVPQFR